VPCLAFDVGTLERRFTGRGVASRADFVGACNEPFAVNLDPASCDVTGVDRVAVAALVLLAGVGGHVGTTGAVHGA